MSADDPLTELQSDIKGYMLQCSNLNHLNIIADDKGALQSTADKAVKTVTPRGGKVGLAAVILRPTMTTANANMPGPQSDAIVTIMIVEHVLGNRGSLGSGIRASAMGTRVLRDLHHFQIGNRTLFSEPSAMRPAETAAGFVAYEITFRIALHNQPIEKTKAVTITNDGGTITLTSATPSSALQYSLDGSYPSLTYTVPFSASSGDLVRALATSASLLPSSISELTI
jgi:hypothetical protein